MLAVHVGEDRRHPCDLVGEEQVLGVGPAVGMDAHQAAARHLHPVDDDGIVSGRTARVGRPGPTTGRRSRSGGSSSRVGPARERSRAVQRCRVSGDISSQRSMISRASGSVARASAFSASVMVSTRRVRISSISVASNSAPGLSPGDLGVVVEDDRQPQQQVGVPGRPGEHRPAPALVAVRRPRPPRTPAARAARRTPPRAPRPSSGCRGTNAWWRRPCPSTGRRNVVDAHARA